MTASTSAGAEATRATGRVALRVGIGIGIGLALVLGAVATGYEVGRSAPPGPSSHAPPRRGAPVGSPSGPAYLAEVPSFAAVSRDGRTLTVFPVEGPCGQPVPQRLAAVQSPRRVSLTLVVHGTHYTEEQLRHMVCATAYFGFGPLPSITLRSPLGSRPVEQGLTARRIPVYGGAQVARPTVLPRGCTPGPVQPSAALNNSGPLFRNPGLVWTCDVVVPFARRAVDPASQLQFGQWRGWVRSLGLPIEERTTVRGYPAIVKVDHVGAVDVVQARSISWREDDQTFVITSSSGLSATAAHSRAVLSAAELVRIADGVRIPSTRTRD